MKIITPQRSLLISIIALFGAVSMLVVVTFAWFVYIEPSFSGPPLNIITSNCEVDFVIDGNELSNPNDLKFENVVPGQRLKVEIRIRNTTDKLGFLMLKLNVTAQDFVVDSVNKDLRAAFAIITFSKNENDENIETVRNFASPDSGTDDMFTIIDGVSIDPWDTQSIFFDLIFLEAVGSDDMNIYQDKTFKIDTISISLTTKQGTDVDAN